MEVEAATFSFKVYRVIETELLQLSNDVQVPMAARNRMVKLEPEMPAAVEIKRDGRRIIEFFFTHGCDT